MNGLMLNTSKTQCIFIGIRGHIAQIPNNTFIKVDDANIVPRTSVKNLGVFFDNYMQFDSHITHIYKKRFGIITYVNRIKEHFSEQAKIWFCNRLFYAKKKKKKKNGIMIWGSTSQAQLQHAPKIQNFAAKVAIGGAKF